MNEYLAIPDSVRQAKLRFGIVGDTARLNAAIERAIKVAPVDLAVLVLGESGTGKEFFPQIIHAFSPRKHSRYIAVNCGAIPEGTIDSELFGHEKGAFTSAISTRKGYFEEADGGTIFLDEVAELPLTTQARLLRVLETGEFMKVGSSTVQKTNVRIVAATNVDMQKAIAEGKFREDLYYRLSGVQIPVPPLRERGNDVILLARKFASDAAEKYTLAPITLSEGCRELLLAYRWPGNVRQLKNIMEQLAIFEGGTEVTKETLLQYIPRNATQYSPVFAGHDRGADSSESLYANEREVLFNMIYRLQQEVAELKAQAAGIMQHRPIPPKPLGIENTGPETPVVDYTETSEVPGENNGIRTLVPYTPTALSIKTGAPLTINAITEDKLPAEEAKSLEDNEKELIRQALERNDGRRKAAAAELKISERTLYRKIKDYGLE